MLVASNPQEKKAGLAHWANRVLEECDKASAGFAADPVHDLRVAIRRCRSMADGFLSVDPDPAWKQMKRLAKPLFSSLGELRDTQVMLEWVGKLSQDGDQVRESLSTALLEKETTLKAAAQEVLAVFDRKRWGALNDHLAQRTSRIPLEGLIFQHLALERWMEAHELHRQALRNRSGVAYHQLRIGIKRFRYTVENFLPMRHEKWSRNLRDLQDALGEVHDFDVLRALIRAHPDTDPRDRVRWQERITEERQKRLNFYRQKMVGKDSLWQVWRSELPSDEVLHAAALEKLQGWASFLDPDVAHTGRVKGIALQLFDGLSQCGMFTTGSEHRRILEAAAILHEVGRSKGQNGKAGGHQKRGYRMICKLKPPVGWSDVEMRKVAIVTRYHRGKLPGLSDSSFVGLRSNQRTELLPIIGILRLANAFDDAHDGNISRVSVERRDGTLAVYAQGLEELSPNAERIARARYLLEATSNLPILIRPLVSHAAASSRTPRPQQRTVGA